MMDIEANKILETCKKLRGEGKFDCLSCLTGIDRGDSFEVVYHLFSYEKKESCEIKVKLDKANPSLPSVSSVWSSANWMERETYDLFGIKFIGHPDLKRILMPPDWVGHPMLKDYKEPAEYKGMTTTR